MKIPSGAGTTPGCCAWIDIYTYMVHWFASSHKQKTVSYLFITINGFLNDPFHKITEDWPHAIHNMLWWVGFRQVSLIVFSSLVAMRRIMRSASKMSSTRGSYILIINLNRVFTQKRRFPIIYHNHGVFNQLSMLYIPVLTPKRPPFNLPCTYIPPVTHY